MLLKRLKRVISASGAGAVRISAMVLELIVSLVLVRVLGANDFGVYSYALSFAQVAVVFAAFGNPLVSTRFFAYYKALGDQDGLGHYVGYARKKLIVNGLIVTLLAALIGYCLSVISDDRYFNAILIFMLSLLPWAATRFYAGCISGNGNVTRAQVPEYIIRPLALLLLLLLWWLYSGEIARYIAILGFLLASIVSFLIAMAWQKNQNVSQGGVARATDNEKEWFKTSLLLTFFGGAQVLGTQIDTLLLGVYTSPDAVAIYRVSYQIMAAIGFSLAVVNIMYAPKFSRFYALKDFVGMQVAAIESARISLIGVMVPALALMFFGNEIVTYVFGDQYAGSSLVALVLVLGVIVSAATGSVATVLNMCGYEKEALVAAIAYVLLAFILCIVLIPGYGVLGAASAAAISLAVKNLYLVARLKQLLGVRSFIF